jgi:hypothetical protein
MIMLLHKEYNMPFTPTVGRGAAELDTADLLQWLLDEKQCEQADDIVNYAAAAETTEVLQFLKARGSVFTADTCMAATRSYNAVHILQYLRSEGCGWDTGTSYCAAYIGDLPLLQWLREQGCPWDSSSIEHAALKEHMHIINWAHDNGCHCDFRCVSECAASSGSMQVLLWVKANSAAAAVAACTPAALSIPLNAAAANGHLDTAKVRHQLH